MNNAQFWHDKGWAEASDGINDLINREKDANAWVVKIREGAEGFLRDNPTTKNPAYFHGIIDCVGHFLRTGGTVKPSDDEVRDDGATHGFKMAHCAED